MIGKPIRSTVKAALRPLLRMSSPRRVDLPPALWRLTRTDDGQLSLDGLRLTDLATRFGTPLYLIDAARLRDNADAFLRVPPGAHAGVECYYSYKTNPVPAMLSRLHAAGVGAEVISEYELWLAQHLGVDAQRIVLNGPGRSPLALRTAVEIGALVQINHREEIDLLARIARAVGKRCRVGLRVVSELGWAGQFGESIADGSALACYRELASRPELEVCALHTHLGAEISSAQTASGLAQCLLDFYAVLRAQLGLQLEILDFGGSLGCRTTTHHSARALGLNRSFGVELCPRSPDEVLSITDYVSTLVGAVEARCHAERWPRPRIFVEPGRALSGDAQLLLCSVTGLKHTGAAGAVHAVLDAGVNIAEPVRSEYHQIFVAGREAATERAYRLVGPICTPMDTLAWSWRLPTLEPGTVLCIMDAGAYFVPFSTSFSFPQPAIALVEHGAAALVRNAETFADMIRRDVLPDTKAARPGSGNTW